MTTLSFSKPGAYLLFCPLHDRDGGRPHFEEGLFKIVTVKQRSLPHSAGSLGSAPSGLVGGPAEQQIRSF